MLLEFKDAELIFGLHRTLMFFVNHRLRVVAEPIATPEDFAAQPPEVRLNIRDTFLANIDLIESFASENPARLSNDELDIVRSWRHFIRGKFYIFREFARHTVFLTTDEPAIAYGVLALTQPFEELARPIPAGHGGDGAVAVEGQDRVRRPVDQLQHFVRRWHP